jgi:hypothetical protein
MKLLETRAACILCNVAVSLACLALPFMVIAAS